jgi:hypothetical protein
MKKITSIIVLMSAVAIFIGAASQTDFTDNNIEYVSKSEKSYKKDFDVKPGGKVNIELRCGGAIEIIGWDKNVVSVDLEVSGRDSDDLNVEIEQDGNDINISSYYDGRQNNGKTHQKLFVNVPREFNIDFETMGGNVKVDKVQGIMEGKTMGGSLELSNLKGQLDLMTMGGGINVSDCEVDGKVKTMGGEILVENVVGDLDASSMGGKVIQRGVKGRETEIGKEVNISTMGGEINVDNAPNGAKVKTMGGNIIINSASKFVDAITYGGDIEIKEVDGKVHAKTLGGDVDVKFIGNGDDKDINLNSLGGNITLYVPSDFSMDVFIEISITEEYADDYGNIEDIKPAGDFNLSGELSKEWDDSNGSPRKYYTAKGSFNGGKNKVVIKTINGEVTLKKI